MRVAIFVLFVFLAVSAVHGQKKPSKGKGKPSKPSKPSKPGKPEKPGKEEEMDGMCIDREKMMKMCLAGSALGEKSLAAKQTCDANEESLGLMRAKKPKGK